MDHAAVTPKPCNHHALRGWALETVYAPDGTTYKRCRRCGRVFYDRWPLEEALTSEPPAPNVQLSGHPAA